MIEYLKGFAITQAVEVPLVLFLLRRRFRREERHVAARCIIATAFFANMSTLPCLWFIFPEMMDFGSAVVAGEATALGVEAICYWLLFEIPVADAFLASFIANCCSVLAGLIIMPPFR